MKDTVVLILAGGDGDRFWPLSDKNSMPFMGKPFAYYHLLQLHKFGLKNAVVVVNNKNKQMYSKLREEFPGLNINLVEQTDPRGMAGAIVSAKKYIGGRQILIRNSSDIYEDLLLSSMLSKLKGNPDGIIAGVAQDSYFPGGYLKIEKDKVTGIVEKPKPDKIPSHIVTIVFDYFKNADSLLSAIANVTSSSDDVFEKAIDLLIKDGLELKFMQYNGFWGYLKFPWHVLDIKSYFLHKLKGQRTRNVSVHKSSILSGDVFIEEGVKILENAKIVGPSYIGRGTIIGQNCLVRESAIGANCVVGYSTEIARSYIGDNCWFHSNYIGDSVISTNVSMGAGTVLANYKLNEGSIKSPVGGKRIDTGKVKLGSIIGANVRIGINASIMPGVKIGRNCFVGPGVLLQNDLADNKSCTVTDIKYEIKPIEMTPTADSRKAILNNLKLS